MYYKVKPKVTSTNCSTEPFNIKFYIYILNVTGSIKNKYKDFIKSKPILIQGIALQQWLDPTHKANYPRLSQIAINILFIPSMSAEVK